MFSVGATVATVALSYLGSVNATSVKLAQELKQESKAVVVDGERDLKLELKDCKRANQKVICNFLLTSLANKNRTIEFTGGGYTSGNSRIIDDSGNEYTALQVQVGSHIHRSAQQAELIPNIPTKAILTFEIPQKVTKFSVIEAAITAYGYNDTKIQAQFRDYEISTSPLTVSKNTDCNNLRQRGK
jgi:hypothetical protein